MERRLERALATAGLALVLGLAGLPAAAYHYPWDQGHDTTDWDDPPAPGPCEGGECQADENDCSSTGSPVYVATGQFKWADTDLKLPGRPGLGITRTYQSNDPREGRFGNGWSFGCDKLLLAVQAAEGEGERTRYLLRLANGKRYAFEENADGAITPPPGLFYAIERRPDGALRLRSRDGSFDEYAQGRLTARVDRNGNRLEYRYDGAGQLVQVADAAGRHLDFAYDSRGRIRTVTDPAGRSWRYDYDLDGNLTAVTDPLGGVRRYTYQAYRPPGDGHTYHQLTRVTDAAGVTEVEVSYNGSKVASYTDGTNRFSYRYDPANRLTTKTDRLGHTWRYHYNEAGQRIEDTDPLGNRVATVRDDNGLATQTTDAAGQVWSSAWDSLGRRLSDTDPLGATTTRSYAGERPEPVKVTGPGGRVSEFSYDANGNPLRITDPAGAVTRLEWNRRGELIGAVDALGRRIETTPNALGLPERITDALGRTTTLEYDALGRLTALTNPAGETTRLGYDALDRLTASTNAAGHTTTYTCDAAGRLLSLTDPKGGQWRYTYDGHGRPISETSPDGRTTTYSYTPDNRLQSETRPDGTTVTYRHDAAGRLIERTTAGEATTYAHDPRGLLTQAANAAATLERQYDAAGRLISETVNGRTVRLSRNMEGEVIQLTAAGTTLDYGRDSRGDIDRLTAQGVHGFTHDLLGQLTRITPPNGLDTRYAYDAAGQLTGIDHTGVMRLAYRHDPAGRITRRQGNGEDWRYAYDRAGRLIQATGLTDSHGYQYDELGNRLDTGGVYDAANRLQEDAAYDYTFDARGNLTARVDKATGERHAYTYNGEDRLIGYEHYPAASATADITATYAHDPLGRRIAKTVNGVTTTYQWLGSQLIAEYDAEDNRTRRYHYAEGHAPVQVEDANGVYQVHSDHLDTPGYLTDPTGTVVWKADYAPYGKAEINEDPDGDGTAVTFNIRFPGQYEDAESGHYYNYLRDYDPSTGRYIESDPIGLAGGLNTYAYVGGNPLFYIDPKGLNAAAGVGVGVALFCARYPSACAAGAVALCRLLGGCGIPDGMMNENPSENDEPKQCPPKGKESKPPFNGPPNGYEEGPRRGREYGPDGGPIRDYDNPHQGADYPHVHEWPNGVREHPGRPYSPIPKSE
jgi:RHS repeat-associated protein